MTKKKKRKTDTWLPLYVGDYLRDTGHLTPAQHGAYLLLLMAQWTSSSGFLTPSLDGLRRIARMDPAEWADAWPVLQAFFTQCPHGFYQGRLAELREEAKENQAKFSQRGAAGAEARWGKKTDGEATGGDASGNANAGGGTDASGILARCPSPSSHDSPDGESSKQRKRGTRLPADWVLTPDWEAEGHRVRMEAGLPLMDLDVEAAKFRDYWKAKSGKDGAKLDWLATWRNWCRNAKAAPGGYGAPARPAGGPRPSGPADRKQVLSDVLRQQIADADAHAGRRNGDDD